MRDIRHDTCSGSGVCASRSTIAVGVAAYPGAGDEVWNTACPGASHLSHGDEVLRDFDLAGGPNARSAALETTRGILASTLGRSPAETDED